MYDVAILLFGVWVGSGFKPPHRLGRAFRAWWRRVRQRSGYEFAKSDHMFFVQLGYCWTGGTRDRTRSIRIISLSLRRARLTDVQRKLVEGGKWIRVVKKPGSDRRFLDVYYEGVLPLIDYLELDFVAEWGI